MKEIKGFILTCGLMLAFLIFTRIDANAAENVLELTSESSEDTIYENGISTFAYSDTWITTVYFTNPYNDEPMISVTLTIPMSYVDGSYVEFEYVNARTECYEGYQYNSHININYNFSGETAYYSREYYVWFEELQVGQYYTLYAFADMYGDRYVTWYLR